MKEKGIKITIICVLVLSSILAIIGFAYNKTRLLVENNFSIKGNDKISVLYGQNYDDEGYYFLSNDKNDLNVKVSNNVDTSKVGNYKVIYTINYNNYYKSLVREVNVIDNEAPTIKLECDDEEFVEVNKEFKGCNYTVTDNYDSTNKIKVTTDGKVNTSKKGDYKITYTATDSSNNTSKKEITVHVKNKDDLNYIEISISNQRLDYYENGKLYLTTPVTTGKNDRTPKGDFKVFNKATNTVLKSGNYAMYVKYWIGFKGYKYGIHDASWRKNFGTKDYFINGSHGCVNTPTDAIAELYKRVKVGMPIHIKE